MTSKLIKLSLLSCCAISTTLTAPMAFAQDNVVTLEEAIKASKVLANFRLRYEGADFDNDTDSADLLSYRARVGFETGSFLDTKFLIEFDHVQNLAGDVNDTVNGNIGFAVIADPNVTELNRFQLKNTSLPDTTVTLGRQRIILDDSRFVGNVGWRQNEQTFDAVRATNTSIKGLKLDVSYLDQVNRIFGDDAPSGRFDSESVLLNANYDVPIEGLDINLSGFGYLLDLSNAGLSSDTYGGKITAKKGAFGLAASYATQTDAGDNPTDFSTDYFFIEGKVKHKGFSGSVGYDVFLNTPTQGLEDFYIRGDYKTGPIGPLPFINFWARYHDFSSNEGGLNFGSEIDAVIATKLTKKTGLLFKFADYNQGDEGTPFSRRRYSVQLDFSF